MTPINDPLLRSVVLLANDNSELYRAICFDALEIIMDFPQVQNGVWSAVWNE